MLLDLCASEDLFDVVEACDIIALEWEYLMLDSICRYALKLSAVVLVYGYELVECCAVALA